MRCFDYSFLENGMLQTLQGNKTGITPGDGVTVYCNRDE